MNLTVVIILAAIALGTLITGLVLSGRSSVTIVSTVEPDLFPLHSNVRSLPLIDPHVPPFPERPSLQQKLLSRPPNPLLIGMDGELVPRGQSNRALLKLMKTIEEEIEERSEPPQSVSGIIPFGQAVGDFPDPEAEYDERQFAPSDWKPEQ